MTTLDPRTKAILLLAFIVIVILTSQMPVLAGEMFVLAAAILVLGFAKAWLKVLGALAPLLIFLFVFYVWAMDWETATVGALRLAASVSAFFFFFQLTTPEDFGNSLVQSRVPYSFVFILVTAMQFAPTLSRQVRNTLDAQRSRGMRLEPDIASIPNFTALLAPLLVQAFTLAEQLAEAMESRGFGSPHRTFVREYRLRGLDFGLMLCGAGAVMAALIFKA